MRKNATFWIEHFNMTRHIEGGSFAEVYKSDLRLAAKQLPASFNGERHSCTHIYFLLEAGQFSAFHRIQSDELWHFYAGGQLIIYEINEEGNLIEHILGSDPDAGETFFTVIKAGHWFASRVAGGTDYALVGCTVSPGFDYADFELAGRQALINQFPEHEAIITALTH